MILMRPPLAPMFRVRHLLAGCALCVCVPVHAEGEPPHPMIDFTRLEQSQSLEGLSTEELKISRATYAATLATITGDGGDASALEQQLLEALLHYDAERIRIVELIPQMIEHYAVDAELAEDMMNFRATLQGVIEELRPNATTLQRYKPYDFRVGVSYMSLMTTLQKHEALRKRMLSDYQDESTLLGQHQSTLRVRYEGVAAARSRLEASYQKSDLTAQIARIDAELIRRQEL